MRPRYATIDDLPRGKVTKWYKSPRGATKRWELTLQWGPASEDEFEALQKTVYRPTCRAFFHGITVTMRTTHHTGPVYVVGVTPEFGDFQYSITARLVGAGPLRRIRKART